MGDETTAPQPQGGEDAGAQGADATAQGAPGDAQGATGGQDGGIVVVEALTKKVAELERDNRQYRAAIKAAQDAQKAQSEAGLTEVEKLRAEVERLTERATTAERRAQEQSLRAASSEVATRLGFRNPTLAMSLITGQVEYDDEGQPTNVESLLMALAKSDPYLISSTDFGGGSRGTSAATQSPDMNALIRSAATRRS